ncbi:MAG: LPS export ABC transporter periplasmic protein LptC [Sphingomonadaceae bacterium]|nr:LPS export ABC transporter periplasmic protein LptC [Sphingomonadaceae bacterium]MCB2085126.1 LPS export ABC transporter periplasmic protein LptC [Sphingomonadaceae bacterium]MCP5390173.1 LPS export ABC transporter periplasmic protein LptC [Sphingomonadaceae bacterium]MCP5392494.1 LPS export ABC transporter periplasmic protein LptC [Sphingomonadaceae bacterium]
MVIKRRIETDEAKERRSQRQHFAAPGGSHDRLVSFLGKVLPMGVGVLAAFMVITPLSPRGEISFLLDRNKVSVIQERLRVDNAMYRGSDNQGRPFSLRAGEAVQQSSREGIVRMDDLLATVVLNEGPARIDAKSGAYDIEGEVVSIDGDVRMTAADGYRMRVSGVAVDLENKRMVGSDGVEGEIPAGSFSANRLEIDMGARTLVLDGAARLRMIPGKLRMP